MKKNTRTEMLLEKNGVEELSRIQLNKFQKQASIKELFERLSPKKQKEHLVHRERNRIMKSYRKEKSYFDGKEFKEIAKPWEKKMREEGLADFIVYEGVDSKTGNDLYMIQPSKTSYSQEKDLYFTLCEYYLASGLIKDKRDQFILEKHIMGCSSQDISSEISINGFKQIDERHVRRLISGLLKEIGIEPITLNQ